MALQVLVYGGRVHPALVYEGRCHVDVGPHIGAPCHTQRQTECVTLRSRVRCVAQEIVPVGGKGGNAFSGTACKGGCALGSLAVGKACTCLQREGLSGIGLGHGQLSVPRPVGALREVACLGHGLAMGICAGICDLRYRRSGVVDIDSYGDGAGAHFPGRCGYAYVAVEIGVPQFRPQVTIAVHMHHAESSLGVVYASLVQGRGADGVYVALLLYIVDVPVSVDPGLEIVVVEVEATAVLAAVNEVVSIGKQVVVEYDGGRALRHKGEVVPHPLDYVVG